jgi:hypothetical protein
MIRFNPVIQIFNLPPLNVLTTDALLLQSRKKAHRQAVIAFDLTIAICAITLKLLQSRLTNGHLILYHMNHVFMRDRMSHFRVHYKLHSMLPSIAKISEQYLADVSLLINLRPRKTLGYLITLEVLMGKRVLFMLGVYDQMQKQNLLSKKYNQLSKQKY